MRKLTYLLFLLFPLFTKAQINHVPNGDFEYYTTCPTAYSQIVRCAGWHQSTTATPDYFNTCVSSTSNISIPSNYFGFQRPASGNAYAGGYTYIDGVSAYREFINRQIIPLQPGRKYSVSLSVSLANNCKYATNNIGVFFYDTVGQLSNANWQTIQPQVSFMHLGAISDTSSSWVRLEGSFIADSAYDNIMIGGFFPLSNILINVVNNSAFNNSYYYYDSILVEALPGFYITNVSDIKLCTNDIFYIDYICDSSFNLNNTFTVQLSDSNGNFNAPINIGSIYHNNSAMITCVIPSQLPTSPNYQIRVIASSNPDTTPVYFKRLSIGNTNNITINTLSNSPVCEGDTLKLSYSIDSLLTSVSWSGPNNYTSISDSVAIPFVTTVMGGQYYFTGHLYGCNINDTIPIQVKPNSKPTIYTNAPICEYDTLTLHANSTTIGVSYSWTGPNGFTSNQQNPSILNTPANATGNYYVTTAVNGCSRTDTILVTVNDAPDSVLLSCNTPVCIKDTLRLNAGTSTGNVSYSWTGPYNFTSSTQNPRFKADIILQTGWYVMTAAIGNCTYTDSIHAVVKTTPAPPSLSYNTSICEGDSLMLAATSSFPNTTFKWTGPNGFTSTQQNPKIGNANIGYTGVYTGTTILNGCSDSTTLTVNIKRSPAAASLSSNSPLCSNDTLLLYAGNTSNTYSWSGPNNFNSSLLDPYILNSATTHSGWYIFTIDSNGCDRADSIYVQVKQTPAIPTITYTTPICVGEALGLSALGNSTSTYNWSGANNYSTTGQSVTRSNIQLADSGVYTVIASQNGCTASASANISINPAPFANIYVTPGDSICTGEVVSFTALPSNAGANPQYAWFINAQQQSFTGQQFYPTGLGNNDVVYCEMTDNVKCSSPYTDQSNTIRMTVLPWLAPSVSITSNPSGLLLPWQYVTFTAHPVNAGTNPQYQWKRNGQDVVGATGSTWSANNLNDNDSISVELVSDYKCPQPAEAMSNGIVVSVAVGVNNVRSENNITLIPNPNNGQFALKGNIGTNGTAQISVLNTLGQIVHQHKTIIKDQTINERIDLQDVANGLYLLRLDINGQRINIKFSVQ